MHNGVYINGMHSISPQPTFNNGFFDAELDNSKRDFLQIIAPNYKEYISPVKLRRMTKIIRLGLIGAIKSLEDAKQEDVDAIIVGSGYGNISDTQKFLNSIIENKERMLIPTSFVQSTHNIVSGSIALMLGNKNYNMTYTHHNLAFEMALLDAIMLIEEGSADTIMLAGIDEITQENYNSKKTAGRWRKAPINPLEIFSNTVENSCLPGESSCFFVMSKQQSENSYAYVADIEMFHKAEEIELSNHLMSFIARNNLNANDIDLIIGGFNGDSIYDNGQFDFLKSLFTSSAFAAYKQFVGEHPTASAFGLWLAAQILSGKPIDKHIWFLEKTKEQSEIKNIIIFQKSYITDGDFSMVLVQKIS